MNAISSMEYGGVLMAKKSYKKDGMCKTFFKLFKSPRDAFREINLEEGIGTALLLLIISVILGRLLVFLIGIFSYRMMLPIYFQEYEYLNTFILAGMQIIGVFLVSLGLYVWLKLFKIKTKLAKTFKIVCFSAVPYLILGAVPFFKMWVFYLSAFFVIFGIKELYKVTGLRSALAVMSAYLVFWIGQIIYGILFMKAIAAI